MSRIATVAAAQMGPIDKDEPRQSTVARMISMMRLSWFSLSWSALRPKGVVMSRTVLWNMAMARILAALR